MAYSSQTQFEVLHRALWVQQAQPQTVFDWKFWEQAARDAKMTIYLNQGVKVKMCDTTHLQTPLAHSTLQPVAKIKIACDSTRAQGPSISACIGLSLQICFKKFIHIIQFVFLANLIAQDAINADRHKQRWQKKFENSKQIL